MDVRTKNTEIAKGTKLDIEEIEALYHGLPDYLAGHTNYPGWKKGVYPTREPAVSGVEEGNLCVIRAGDCIAGWRVRLGSI